VFANRHQCTSVIHFMFMHMRRFCAPFLEDDFTMAFFSLRTMLLYARTMIEEELIT
jgi:hypothetical protein